MGQGRAGPSENDGQCIPCHGPGRAKCRYYQYWHSSGSDPDNGLSLLDNRCNLGCFFLLGPAFWGQKVGFKVFAWGHPLNTTFHG